MFEIFLVILLGITFGLAAGLLPGYGSSAVVVSSAPVLMQLPAELCILFYAAVVQSAQFSSSVSALNFNVMGELTSHPALEERNIILKTGSQLDALRITGIASILGCVISIVLFQVLLSWYGSQPILLRTETAFLISLCIILFSLLMKQNPWATNLLLVIVGIILSQIGLSDVGSQERHFLTFGITYLYSGIPMVSILAGFIAVPAIIKSLKFKSVNVLEITSTLHTRFPWLSSIRGSIIGTISGLLPVIGTNISCHAAWLVERKFYSKDTAKDSLARLAAAESANNSSQVSVLIPLMLLGIAIVPSEMILLNLLQLKNWIPNLDGWTWYGIPFQFWLIVTLFTSCAISYLACYPLIKLINQTVGKHLNIINIAAIVIMAVGIIYAGIQVDAGTFFLICFGIFSAVAIKFRRIEFLPLVAGFFIGDLAINSIQILIDLYM